MPEPHPPEPRASDSPRPRDSSAAAGTPGPPGAPRIVNLAGYRFVPMDDPAALVERLRARLGAAGVRGTVLVAGEGINVAIAGSRAACEAARAAFDAEPRLRDLALKESLSRAIPFAKLKVRPRGEIITFDGPGTDAAAISRPSAPAISPAALRERIEAGDAPKLLDVRNDYETGRGGFEGATTLPIGDFGEFRAAVEAALDEGGLRLDEPLVTFCTGGVRCEKAAPWLLERGFDDVAQIEGGILAWFAECGDAHWHGDCFVFDERGALTPSLEPATPASPCPDRDPAPGPDHSRTAADTV